MIILKVRSDAVTGLLDDVVVTDAATPTATVVGYEQAFWKANMSLPCNNGAD